MNASPYPDLAKEMLDLWQKQMASMMGDKKFIEAMLGLFKNMQNPNDAQPNASSHSANPSDHQRDELASLAFRLAMCERRIIALEGQVAGKKPAKKSARPAKPQAAKRPTGRGKKAD